MTQASSPTKKFGQKILNLAIETTTNSSGAIFNTFEALEPHELEMIRDELVHNGIPPFAVGPLHKLMSSRGDGAVTNLLNQDRSPQLHRVAGHAGPWFRAICELW